MKFFEAIIVSFSTRLRAFARRFLRAPQHFLHRSATIVAAIQAPTTQLSSHNFQPTTPLAPPCAPINVISANLWHDWPRYRQLLGRLEAFARFVDAAQTDIILLQEVARTPEIRIDQWLAERLGMQAVYTRVNGHQPAIGFEEGLAVLSRFPLITPHWCQLGASAFRLARRMALGAQVSTPCGPLMAYSVHLGLAARENQRQLQRLQTWVLNTALEHTAFIGGDFNTHETHAPIRQLQTVWLDAFRHINPVGDGTTHTLYWPWGKPLLRHRLDYLFLKNGTIPWKIETACHFSVPVGQAGHSDHRAIQARFMPG